MARSTARVAVPLLVLLVPALAWWLGGQVQSPRQKAAEAKAPPASPLTAPVEERRLRRMVTLRGTVHAGREVKVVPEVDSGDRKPLVTRLDLKTGARVRSGTRLLEIAGRPVFALAGRVPMYRDLRRGDSGEDVAQVQRSLRDLGYPSYDRSGSFGPGTEQAAQRFFRARGYPPTMEEPPGPGNDDPPGNDSGRPGDPPKKRFILSADEILFVPTLPAQVSSLSVRVGDRVGGEVMRLSTGRPRIRASLPGGMVDEVEPGTPVEVEVDGRTVRGEVSDVSRPKPGASAPPAGDGGGDGGGDEPGGKGSPEAVIAVDTSLPADLVGTELLVRAIVMDTGSPVLAVPSAAVWTRADGSSHVIVHDGPRRVREVTVETGRSADGYVELTRADGVTVGAEVELGRGG